MNTRMTLLGVVVIVLSSVSGACAVGDSKRSGATNNTDANISPELEQWMSSGQYFQYDGHQIFYQDNQVESGKTILMIHGFPTSAWDWHELIGTMDQKYRIVAIDMLGFGFSDKPRKHNYSINEQVEIHKALLEKIGINQVHIIAHDYGSLVAQEMLHRFNNNQQAQPAIQSLAILNGPINMLEIDSNLSFSLRLQKNIIEGPLGGFISQFTNKFAFDLLFVTFFGDDTRPSDQALRDNWFVMSRHGGRTLFHELTHFYDEGLKQGDRWNNAITGTEVPLLAINGSDDPILGEFTLDDFSALYPKAEIEVLDSIGHYPQLEDPRSVSNIYRQFLAGLDNTRNLHRTVSAL